MKVQLMPILPNQFTWARDYLNTHGYDPLGDPTIIRDRPWSCVSCFTTAKGPIFLKSMAEPYANEAVLLLFLAQNGIHHITEVIASNQELSCFLMKGAGWPLRKKQISDFKGDVFCHFLKIYAPIQITCISLVDKLLALGVNDWRLEKLPHLYKDFVSNTHLLESDGLTLEEIEHLKELSPQVNRLCVKLSEFGIPETLEHGDFHDNNILILDDQITINDWGDSFISHPFFSLAAALDSAKRNHNLQESDQRYTEARDAYLNQWHDYVPADQLLNALDSAQKLHFIIFAMGFSRIYTCPGIENFPEFKGYGAESLRNFIRLTKEKII